MYVFCITLAFGDKPCQFFKVFHFGKYHSQNLQDEYLWEGKVAHKIWQQEVSRQLPLLRNTLLMNTVFKYGTFLK
jgi:hypothetical protein